MHLCPHPPPCIFSTYTAKSWNTKELSKPAFYANADRKGEHRSIRETDGSAACGAEHRVMYDHLHKLPAALRREAAVRYRPSTTIAR